jgi:hypothetical protein
LTQRKSKTTKEIIEETNTKLSTKREKLTRKELADLTEEKYQVAKSPGGYYLLDKKGNPVARTNRRKEANEVKRRLEEKEQGIEHKSVDILKKR